MSDLLGCSPNGAIAYFSHFGEPGRLTRSTFDHISGAIVSPFQFSTCGRSGIMPEGPSRLTARWDGGHLPEPRSEVVQKAGTWPGRCCRS